MLEQLWGFCREELRDQFKEVTIQTLNRTDVTICHELTHSAKKGQNSIFNIIEDICWIIGCTHFSIPNVLF